MAIYISLIAHIYFNLKLNTQAYIYISFLENPVGFCLERLKESIYL